VDLDPSVSVDGNVAPAVDLDLDFHGTRRSPRRLQGLLETDGAFLDEIGELPEATIKPTTPERVLDPPRDAASTAVVRQRLRRESAVRCAPGAASSHRVRAWSHRAFPSRRDFRKHAATRNVRR
jgi:hypothetical protein